MATTIRLEDHLEELPHEALSLVVRLTQAIAAIVATSVDTMRTIVTNTTAAAAALDVTDRTRDRVHTRATDAGVPAAVLVVVVPEIVAAEILAVVRK